MKSAHTHLFVLRLGRQQSIGPIQLHRMWKTACGSAAITVTRQHEVPRTNSAIYLLAAHSEAAHPHAEQQMRDMLEKDGFSFRLMRSS